MWMLPLYQHVNQKSDDADDDDEQHHWYIVKMLNHRFNNVLHNIAFLTYLQEPIRYCLNNVSSSDFLLMCRYWGNIHIPFQVAGLLCAWQISYKISRYVYHESFHVILGLPGSCFPSICMSKALFTAPLEHSTSRAISPPE